MNGKWDHWIWRLATNPLILAVTAILQGKVLFDMLRGSGESMEAVFARWLLPLAISVALAVAVAFYGMRNFWSLTRTVLIGFAVVMLAQPMINTYVSIILQSS